MRFRRSRSEAEPSERVEPLNDAERQWVESSVENVRSTLGELGIEPGGRLTPEALDELWAAFLELEHDDPNVPINLVGLAFGELLVERLQVAWAVVSDEHGTEIAVRGASDFTVFPTNFVAKRWERRETGFLAPAFEELARTIGELRAGRDPG